MPANTLDHAPISAVLIAKLVLPETDFLRLDEIVIASDCVTITATSCQTQALCPSCRETASREHSRYTRSPGDLPLAGRRIRLRLNVRRFFCDNPACQRRTFVERLPGVVRTCARRTERLAEMQCQPCRSGTTVSCRSALRPLGRYTGCLVRSPSGCQDHQP